MQNGLSALYNFTGFHAVNFIANFFTSLYDMSFIFNTTFLEIH